MLTFSKDIEKERDNLQKEFGREPSAGDIFKCVVSSYDGFH
jgi:hypothetical protein